MNPPFSVASLLRWGPALGRQGARTRAALALTLSASLGCTSTETVPTAARYALARTTTADFVKLPTASGGTVEVGPSSTFYIDNEVVTAGELYWSEWGLFRKTGERIASWDSIGSIRVEQLDGAATVAVTATVAIIVVALAALLGKGGGGNLGGGKGGGGGGGKGGGGGGGSTPSAHGSAPNPSPIIPDPRYTEVAFRTFEAVSNMSRGPGVTVGISQEEESETATPLFARGARRRANIRLLARAEGSACWPGAGSQGDCIVSGARAGVRLLDMFELTGGVRVESNSLQNKAYAVFGAMLHGESPAAHWFALAVGASVAFDQTRAHVVPQLAARFRPFINAGFWLGVVPVEPVYDTATDTWSMASGVEVTGEF